MRGESEHIFLPAAEYEKMLKETQKEAPKEACGLIAGERTTKGIHICKVYILKNMDQSAEHFSLDPKEQLQAVKEMRNIGILPLGNWHSHPATPSRPSPEDIRLAYDRSAVYLILSLKDEAPVLNAFHIEDGTVRKEILEIT